MTIVADSGSTKTAWACVESGRTALTEGLNPHFTDDDAFMAACGKARHELAASGQQCSVVFYGAGCGSAQARERVARLIASAFRTSHTVVATDMLAACLATSDGRRSLVGILGTGSNACLFDGSAIERQSVSTGFILGDKGSANHVGRVLTDAYLSGNMPDHVMHLFHDLCPMSKDELMEAVYLKPRANRFLASLAPVAVSNLDDDYCRNVVERCLSGWRVDVLLPLSKGAGTVVVNAVGGLAKAAEGLLGEVLAEAGLRLGSVVASPMAGLLRHHAAQ